MKQEGKGATPGSELGKRIGDGGRDAPTLLLDLRRRQVSSGREGPLQILNVGADSQRALELMSHFGFEFYLDQFEMRWAYSW